MSFFSMKLKNLFIFLCPCVCMITNNHCTGDNITCYENIIEEQINQSIYYKLPKNAYSYKPLEENDVKDFGTFDFIIIGSGSTGSVIANRLSKIKEWNILLLEAGSFGGEVNDIPNMVQSIVHSDYNWNYASTPQSTACLDMADKMCSYPRGKGIGGSTLINALFYSRGNRLDFDRWSQQGNPGWSYNEVLPYFKISENFVKNDRNATADFAYHGSGGDLNVEYHLPRHPLTDLWLEANKEKGFKVVDYNGEEQTGVSASQLNTKNGRRNHAGNAFIKPIRTRPNLKILTETFVIKIMIKGKRARGVKFVRKKQTYIAKTRKEVILSAGAIASPQLLMLSGIGPAGYLGKLGIEVIEDLEVGSVLRDHPSFYGLYFDSNRSKTETVLGTDVEQYLNGYGPLTVAGNSESLGFYQTKFEKEHDYPDLEILMIPIDGFFDGLQKRMSSAKKTVWQHLDQTRSFALHVIGLHSKSVGTVRLRSPDPFDYPLIDSRFLSDENNADIDTLHEGIKLALNLINTKAFQRINATLFKQDLASCRDEPYLSESYWYCALRYFTGNLYHPVGTCPMGPDRYKGAVVDSETKVHGINDLRVADASIFPFTLSGHPNAVCVMIGEKVSDLIKRRYL